MMSLLTFNQRVDVLAKLSSGANLARAETRLKTGAAIKTWLNQTTSLVFSKRWIHFLITRLLPIDDVTRFSGKPDWTFATA